MSHVLNSLKSYIFKVVEGNPDLGKIDHETKLSSLGFVDEDTFAFLFGLLQEDFGVKVPDKSEYMEEFKKVGDLICYIEEHSSCMSAWEKEVSRSWYAFFIDKNIYLL